MSDDLQMVCTNEPQQQNDALGISLYKINVSHTVKSPKPIFGLADKLGFGKYDPWSQLIKAGNFTAKLAAPMLFSNDQVPAARNFIDLTSAHLYTVPHVVRNGFYQVKAEIEKPLQKMFKSKTPSACRPCTTCTVDGIAPRNYQGPWL